MGTVAGVLSRSYHGLLIAAMAPPKTAAYPPAARTLLLANLEEIALYDGIGYPLFTNQYVGEHKDGKPAPTVTPTGYRRLERFHLEGTTPVWTFAVADALLEKRVWMQQGANTTYVQYRLARGSRPMELNLAAMVTHRDHHNDQEPPADWLFRIEPVGNGLRVTAFDDAPPLYLLSQRATFEPRHEWREGFFLAVENYRGLKDVESYPHAGDAHAVLQPGESLTVVASTEASPNLDGATAFAERRAYEQSLLRRSNVSRNTAPAYSQAVEHLVLAADQFVVRRALPNEADGRSVIAGYPWFGDWGRDTMISLPGLTLVTGRHDLAARILRTFAHFVSKGMLPNRFPDAGEEPEYNTIDATLWYFEAIRAYYAATGDFDLVRELYPVLQDIVAWHQKGTRYNIHLDPADGLVYGGEEGVQLTWMDAKAGDWVVTPRIGKPVEINALWYNAMCSLAEFAQQLGRTDDATAYGILADRTRASFGRFWYEAGGYCYDVIDGPQGDDTSLRPNQLFAASLFHSPLSQGQQRSVVDVCARHLLTSHGLRSLAPADPAYIGRYGGDRITRDAAYHQGTVWGWLIGPFVSAHLRAYGNPGLTRSYLLPMLYHLDGHCVGSMSEIFDGDPPFTPRGCIAQAWTIAEVLRTWRELDSGKEGEK